MHKIILLFIIVFSLFSSSCEIFEGEDGDYVFKINFRKKNIVFDLSTDGGVCPHPIVISDSNYKLLFLVNSPTNDRNNLDYPPPKLFWSAQSSHDWLNFSDNPNYVLTTDCRLIAAVDEDSLDSNGEVFLDFKIINMISGDEAVVQGKYLPSDFKDSSECNSDGAYRVSEYPQVPVCFNSLPINETVEFEPPVSIDYLEEQIRDYYDNEYLNWQCIGD